MNRRAGPPGTGEVRIRLEAVDAGAAAQILALLETAGRVSDVETLDRSTPRQGRGRTPRSAPVPGLAHTYLTVHPDPTHASRTDRQTGDPQ